MQTGLWLREGLKDTLASREATTVRYVKVFGKQAFREALYELHRMAFRGYCPIVHIEAHGDEEHGIAVGNDEFMSWREFGEILYGINIVCQNNVGVVLAACHGMYAIDILDIEKPCPYTFLIAPTGEIRSESIKTEMINFYRSLFKTLNLAKAVEELTEFDIFRSDKFFYMVFVRAYRAICIGKKGHDHVEKLLTRAVHEFSPNGQQLSAFRKMFKKNNSRPVKTYERMGDIFLHGAELAKYDEVEQFARELAAVTK